MQNYPGKWLIALPCHHPKWPRYCHRCKKLAAGCIATKTLTLPVEERYEDVIVGNPEPRIIDVNAYESIAITYEQRVIPAIPGTIVSFSLTACLKCRIFIISKEHKDNEHSGGIYGAVRAQWDMYVVPVKEYLVEARP